jgi:hypothetical protein
VKCYKSGTNVTPVQLTRGEFEAVQEFRRDARPGQQTRLAQNMFKAYSGPILNAVSFQIPVMITTGETGSRSPDMSGVGSSDKHAGVLTCDEVLRLFPSNKSEGDVNHVFQF